MAKEYDPLAQVQRAPMKEVKLTPAQEQAWTKCRTKIIWSCPAFAHILYTMMIPKGQEDLAVFTRDIPIAATDGISMYLNPDTFFKLTLQEQVFVGLHEVAHNIFDHCALMHAFRKRGKVSYANGTSLPYIPDLMNIAADAVINDLLIDAQVGSMPKNGVHDKNIAVGTDSVIDAYKKVFEKAKIIPIGNPSAPGNGKPGFDVHLAPGQGKGEDPQKAAEGRNEAEWATAVAAGMASARAQGKLPAMMERMFGEVLSPQISWQEHIQSFFARKVGNGSYDWMRADRRLITRMPDPIFAPGRAGRGAGTIVIGADTSGSMTPKDIDLYFAEMFGILDDVRPKRVVVMWCDASIGRIDEVEDVSDLLTIRGKGAPGGGGTDFRPVFNEIKSMGLEPDALVFFTDGLGTFPAASDVSYPVLWGSILSAPDHYPLGDVVMLPKV